MPRCYDKILYHGTNKENIEPIMREGLKPTYLGNSIICMSPTQGAARNFGDIILEVNVKGYELSCFEGCMEWERFCWTSEPIPPQRLKILEV